MQKLLLIAIIFLSAFSLAQAHDEPQTYDQVSFSVSAQQEIDNDILVITLRAHEKGRDLESLSATTRPLHGMKKASRKDGRFPRAFP